MQEGVESSRVTELDWWQEKEFQYMPRVAAGAEEAKNDIKPLVARFVCTPCQHFSGRSLADRDETLWAR